MYTIDILWVIHLLVLHWFADFICQSDWMATNKSNNWMALSAHVAVYTIVLWVGLILPNFRHGVTSDVWFADAVFVLVNGGLHFITDAITNRITSKLWFFERQVGIWAQADYAYPKHNKTLVNPWTPLEGNQRHWFFVMIGLDQFIHYCCLFGTFVWLFQ